MHKNVLNNKQLKLLIQFKNLSADFCLVGGTAIALYIGHRESIDLDLFSNKEFKNSTIQRKISHQNKIEKVLIDELDEYTILAGGVRTTFFNYPFKIDFSEKLNNIIKLPDLLTLAAMKAYALGRRAKWKDYVDLYFIIKDYHSIKEIVKKAKQIFGKEFNEKIFRTQLAYFKDIDKSEEIIYKKGFKIDDKFVEKALIKFSLEE